MPVEVRVTFHRIIRIDTAQQSFAAEVLLQAKWSDSDLEGQTQEVTTYNGTLSINAVLLTIFSFYIQENFYLTKI